SSIVRANTNPTAASAVDFTVTFTESVTGVDVADFALTTTGLTGTSVTNVTGSGTTYTVTVNTGSGTTGTLRLDLSAGATLTDTAGNAYAGGGFTGGETYTIDRSAPSVTSATRNDPNPTHAASVQYTVTFTQSVTGVDTTDFQATVTGGAITGQSVSGVSGSGTTYTVTVNTGSGDGTLRLDVLNDGTIKSGTNVPLSGGTFNGEVYTVDKTPPTVTSVNRVTGTPTNAASVQFTVTFSESVTGTSNSDFQLTTTGSVSGASVTGVTGSGATRTVTVNTGSGDGTIRCDVVTGGTIIDAAGNLFATPFSSGQVYTIDKTAPAVVSINKASADPSSAATVDFTVTFSESVTGVGSGGFTVTAPALTGTSVAGFSGSGTTYTVTVNTGSGNGSLRLDFNGGGPVIDAAGNSAAAFSSGQSYTMTGTPAPPTGLAATAGNAHVALTWDAQDEASSFAVKRATVSGGPYTTLNAGVATNSFDDLTASNFTTYYYVIAANGLRGSSANSAEVSATPIGPLNAGDLFDYRVGDGSGSLSGNAAPVFIEERNPTTGTVVQTIPMPTAVSGSNRRLVAAGSSTSEGFLSVSGNGQYIVVTGYDANVATAGVATSSSSTTNRVIGRIAMTGAVDTTTALNTFSGGNIRSATSLDGANFWAVGSNTGEIYAGFGANTQTTVANNVTNLRVTNIFGGQLYTSSGSGTTRLATVGAGTPTTTGNTIANLPGFPTTGSPESFF
ncbi:MAG TPA: Ig-like domain-containing protein, partial [Thermoanaerobaculia bacterium]|nr:Ig-like domain-containing protein [Thermoanaerobaculia bacterium]